MTHFWAFLYHLSWKLYTRPFMQINGWYYNAIHLRLMNRLCRADVAEAQKKVGERLRKIRKERIQ